jgi:hypothetical protein
MHTISISSAPRRAPTRRLLTTALLCASLLSACGGGGGGGAPSTNPPAATGSANGGDNASATWSFPLGMSWASPGALGASSDVISGAAGMDNTSAARVTPMQAVRSSQADAVATGRLSLSGSGLLDDGTLFQTADRAHAACYGPAVAYAHHDNASGQSGTLPSGEVAMWQDLDGGRPCAAAEVDAQLGPLSAQAHQAVLLLAAMRQVATDNGITPPPAGGQTDLTSALQARLGQDLGAASILSARVALNADRSEYTWRLLLARGSGPNAQTLEITMLHTPADTSTRYAGVVRLALSYLSADSARGCSDQVDSQTGLYKVAHMVSLGYNRQDEWLSLRLRTGQYCGQGSGDQHFDGLAATAMSGELDPAVYLSGGVRGSTLGWRRGFLRMASDTTMSSQTTDFALAWQDLPLAGTSQARLFAGHSAFNPSTSARTLAIYHGYTDDISHTDGTLRGMVCNWAGPGSTRTLHNAYQAQVMNLAASDADWALARSQIAYAPTNSCSASSTMQFDLNGNGVIETAEGQGFASQLAVPTGTNDAADELMQEGYLAPLLLM